MQAVRCTNFWCMHAYRHKEQACCLISQLHVNILVLFQHAANVVASLLENLSDGALCICFAHCKLTTWEAPPSVTSIAPYQQALCEAGLNQNGPPDWHSMLVIVECLVNLFQLCTKRLQPRALVENQSCKVLQAQRGQVCVLGLLTHVILQYETEGRRVVVSERTGIDEGGRQAHSKEHAKLWGAHLVVPPGLFNAE